MKQKIFLANFKSEEIPTGKKAVYPSEMFVTTD
jgi:hypothetical protein